eukprot:Rhum_TRINITY_DN6554_c0_g1::Rhum_TRINITY_DN6554_c0_g1_i2::g.20404::m.20404
MRRVLLCSAVRRCTGGGGGGGSANGLAVQVRHVVDVTEALEVFGMDIGVPYPRGKAGRDNHPALVGANREGLQKRYKELARVYHPDAAAGSTEQMTRVNQAYALLKDVLPSRPDSTHDVDEADDQEAANKYQKPEEPEHMKRRRETASEEDMKMARDFAAGAGARDHLRAHRDSQVSELNEWADFLEQEALAAMRARRNAPPEEACAAKRQLKQENNGSIRKTSGVTAKAGSWI